MNNSVGVLLRIYISKTIKILFSNPSHNVNNKLGVCQTVFHWILHQMVNL